MLEEELFKYFAAKYSDYFFINDFKDLVIKGTERNPYCPEYRIAVVYNGSINYSKLCAKRTNNSNKELLFNIFLDAANTKIELGDPKLLSTLEREFKKWIKRYGKLIKKNNK